MVLRRFEVAEESMLPTLSPGDEFVATDSRRARPGDVVALRHPERSDFWLVKRMESNLPDGKAWVVSDNLEATRADSRTFGGVPLENLMPMVERLDPDTFAEALALLTTEDPHLAAEADRHGIPEFWSREPGFPTLVLLILEQQVTLESGAAVYRRVLERCRTVDPLRILEVGDAGLREAGTTRQKASYIVGLADAIQSGGFSLDRLPRLSVNTARDALLAVRGIGPWTADAYLLSALGHIDLFPLGDRALQVGVKEALHLDHVPLGDELEEISRRWRPIRSAAAQLIWHGYLGRRGRSEL